MIDDGTWYEAHDAAVVVQSIRKIVVFTGSCAERFVETADGEVCVTFVRYIK